MKWKVFDPKSWAALLSSLARIKGAADANASAVSGLGADLALFSQLTAQEIAGKQDKSLKVNITIPVTGWNNDSTADYPMYYDIAVTGITEKDRADVTIAPGSVETATACGLCPTTETLEGKIRLRSVTEPSEQIVAEYWLYSGKE